VVPEKRKLMVVGAAIAAAFALPGCAPAGYNAADYGGAQPVANAAGDSANANAGDKATGDKATDDTANDSGDAAAADKGATELPDDQVTDKLVGTKVARMGEVIENGAGFVLYRFDKDTAKPKAKSTCNGDCAKVWHPALTNDGKPELKGIDANLVGTVTRDDGTKQLTVNGWPIYTYIGDKKPGTWKGQNVGGTWFVIKPDGTKNLTCLPAISKPVAPPADDSGDKSSGDNSGSAGSDYSY
jgi:predicted lipoprotein with Yx(FWY)xxD motif